MINLIWEERTTDCSDLTDINTEKSENSDKSVVHMHTTSVS